jgi:hypothetical protein
VRKYVFSGVIRYSIPCLVYVAFPHPASITNPLFNIRPKPLLEREFRFCRTVQLDLTALHGIKVILLVLCVVLCKESLVARFACCSKTIFPSLVSMKRGKWKLQFACSTDFSHMLSVHQQALKSKFPKIRLVRLVRLERTTRRLKAGGSDQLSYSPVFNHAPQTHSASTRPFFIFTTLLSSAMVTTV